MGEPTSEPSSLASEFLQLDREMTVQRMRAVGQRIAFAALDSSEMLGARDHNTPRPPEKEVPSFRNLASHHCCFPYTPRELGCS